MKIVKRILMTVMLPVLFFVVFLAATQGRFASPSIIRAILRTSVYPCILCMAMSMNMSMGMWDFSIGAVVTVSAILGGNLSLALGWGVPGIVVFCILIAVAVSTISGLAYNLFKVPSLVLSIGLAMVYEGLPRLFVSAGLSTKRAHGILSNSPYCFIILAIAFVIYFIIQTYTVHGKNMAVIGANQDVAYRSGVNLPKTKLQSYMLTGFFVGIASVIYVGNHTSIAVPSNLSSVSSIFDAMMGFFVASFLARYCGLPVGIIVGVVTMRILNTGLVSCGMSSSVNQILTGFFLLALLVFSANQNLITDIKTRRTVAKAANEKYATAV